MNSEEIKLILEKKKNEELKEIAKELNINGVSRLSKKNLIIKILENPIAEIAQVLGFQVSFIVDGNKDSEATQEALELARLSGKNQKKEINLARNGIIVAFIFGALGLLWAIYTHYSSTNIPQIINSDENIDTQKELDSLYKIKILSKNSDSQSNEPKTDENSNVEQSLSDQKKVEPLKTKQEQKSNKEDEFVELLNQTREEIPIKNPDRKVSNNNVEKPKIEIYKLKILNSDAKFIVINKDTFSNSSDGWFNTLVVSGYNNFEIYNQRGDRIFRDSINIPPSDSTLRFYGKTHTFYEK